MKTGLTIFSVLFFGMLIAGCSKNFIEIYTDGQQQHHSDNDTTGTNPVSNSTLVSFHANIESLNLTKSLTKSMTPMQVGEKVSIYAYDSTTNKLVANGLYQTTALGILSGVNGYKMYLPTDTYDFYSVSCNNDSTPPSFSNYTSEPLSNGIDYLWWSANNQEISTENFDLQITFTHSCSQIVFEVAAGEGITIDSLVSIYTTAPTEGTTMNLKTGVITPSTTHQVGFINELGLNGLTGQSILLPTAQMPYLGAILTLYINGESSSRIYGTQIPIPNGTLAAGNSYLYKLIINANNVETSSVEIVGWTLVNETGSPIYPSQLYP